MRKQESHEFIRGNVNDLEYRVDLALLDLEDLKRELKELGKKVRVDVALLLLERAEVAVKGISEDSS